jgi:two-component system, OmpR family, response regulator
MFMDGILLAQRLASLHNRAMHRILLIDDDAHLAAPLATYFARFDLQLDSAAHPVDGLARLRGRHYDAAILDVMLPGMDGFALCREIRHTPGISEIPIVMLTARGEVTDRVVGLELGADDYLPKPFEPRELVARVQTILRRQRGPAVSATPGSQRLVFDGLAIDLAAREVRRAGEPLELTGTEFELLALLALEPGKVFSRDDILNRLRGHEAELYTRAVDIVVSRLRKKLEPLDCIKTLRNAGYAFGLARPAPGIAS